MQRLLAYLVIGITEGLLYGLLALGIVLVYKGSRILNFAQTSFALVAAFVAWWFTSRASFLPFAEGSRPRYAIAAVLAIVLAGLNGLGVEHGVIQRLKSAPRLVILVATLAVASGNAGLVLVLFARNEEQINTPRSLPSFVTKEFVIGGRPIPGADVEVFIVVPLICAGLALFFTRTRFGVAVRAAAENGDAARLLGISASRVSKFVWVTGSVLAAIAGLLITEHRRSLDQASISTGFLLFGLIAALVGGLSSLPGAVVGGLTVGILQALAGWAFPEQEGLDAAVLVALVVAILAFRPQGLFGQREDTEDRAAFVQTLRGLPKVLQESAAARGLSATAPIVVLGVLGISLVVGPRTNTVMATIACYAIVGISLTVLLGFTGQISLGHWGLVGFGGYVMATAVDRRGLPWPVGIPLSVLACTVLAVLLGLPALRIKGLYLAVATMAFHVACSRYLFDKLGGGTAGVPVDRPKLGPFDLDSISGRELTFTCVAGVLVAMLLARNLLRSRAGRSLLAVRENEKAAATLGIDLTKAKLLAFAVSGGLAGLAGSLYVSVLGQAEPGTWDLAISFTLVSMVVIGGLGSLTGSVLGALVVVGLPLLFDGINDWVVLIGTGTLLFVVVTRVPGGLAGMVQGIRNGLVRSFATLDPEARRRLAETSGPAGAAGSLAPTAR